MSTVPPLERALLRLDAVAVWLCMLGLIGALSTSSGLRRMAGRKALQNSCDSVR